MASPPRCLDGTNYPSSTPCDRRAGDLNAAWPVSSLKSVHRSWFVIPAAALSAATGEFYSARHIIISCVLTLEVATSTRAWEKSSKIPTFYENFQME